MRSVGEIKKETVLKYIEQLKKEFAISSEGLVALLQEQSSSFIPVDLFATRNASGLQTLVTYLKKKYGYSFRKIGDILNRNERTVWTAYHQAKRRLKTEFDIPEEATEFIPITRFRDRKFSVLEHIVSFLKEKEYANKDIALLLNRTQTTVSTVLGRASKKRGESK